MFEEATGHVYEHAVERHLTMTSPFYLALVRLRVRHAYWTSFINDRGFRHIKNEDDFSGVTYAFWLITVQSEERYHERLKKERSTKRCLLSSAIRQQH